MRAPSFGSVFAGFAVFFGLAVPNYSQTPQPPAASPATPSTVTPAQDKGVDAIRILYTGKMMGYFRIPDWQGPTALGDGCKDPARQKPRSDAAAEFDQLLSDEFQIDKTKGAILLGAGDNFAPEIEARDFCDPPPGQAGQGRSYQRVGKELFDWDAPSQSWIRSDAHTAANKTPASGLFMIPTDNIANFFVREGYVAMVPGKQDFYFGPERMRELARYLATQPIPSTVRTLHNEGEGPQMLAANLIIETKWKTAHSPLPDSENPPWFIPRFPTAADLVGNAATPDLDIKVTGLSDGAKVYPWFRGVTFELSGEKAQGMLAPIVNSSTFYLCGVDANTPGDPNAIPRPVNDGPCKVLEKKAGQKPGQFTLDFPWVDSRHFYTLRAGMNYGLCAIVAESNVKAADGSFTFCERFSVYTPFFQSSGESDDKRCSDLGNPACYHDPDPYVLIETQDENGIPEDVAIFGVVDPLIGDNVGLLNFAWSNSVSADFETGTYAQDPAEATKQMLDSFGRRFDEEGYTKEIADGRRRLIKVLMAQMNPEEAQVLGTRLKDFQVVVSAADAEMATVGDTVTSEWNAPRAGSVRHPMLMAIPEPYFAGDRNPKAVADIGRLDIHISSDANPKWALFSTHMELGKPPDQASSKSTAPVFWKAVESALKRDCLPQGFDSKSQSDQIEYLALCEMQKQTNADVVLLQKRDFFAALPGDAGDITSVNSSQPENVLQQLLDRIMWKGDFVKLLYVPGSAIQSALKLSKAFDSLDRSNLSIGDHKNRGLLSVGITYDAAHAEYLINGNRLNPTQLYSVATSDFIGGGDTGYPDFAAAQIRPPAVPTDFDSELMTVSGIVCRGLAGDMWEAHCIGPIDRDTYLDEIAASPTDTGPSKTPGEELRAWTVFHHPRAVPGDTGAALQGPASLQAQMDRAVEYRPLWDFKLVKATFGLTHLGHNGSDAQIDANFGGITTPGVNSHRYTNWASDFQAQLDRNWRRYQLFASPGYSFNVQYKGQSDAARQVNQIADLATFDLGFARLWSERGSEHRDLVFTAHFETPLQQTFTAFTLKSTPASVLSFSQPRSYTVLFRSGFRWQKRVSSIEFGPEGGHQWEAVDGLEFITKGKVTATCLAKSSQNYSTCVSNDSNPKVTNPPTITASSMGTVLQGGRDHAGMYWKINLTVPLRPRINYIFSDTGDWFFVNFGTENSTDTRFRDISQHQLRFSIFPSLSIGPELDLLFYENKSSGKLKGTFLRQDQILMKAQFAFDMFNRRQKRDQIEYAPASK